MARSRNIKPSFFDNDELADLDPLARILFIGMWTIADYKGEFEWREKRIKAKLLPYDDCDIKKLAINLDKSRFIRFYSDGDKIFVKVVNFEQHQNPHKNEREKGSEIPEYKEGMRQVIDFKGLTINHDLSRQNHDEDGTNRADSFNLIPDSFNPLLKEGRQAPKSPRFKKPSIQQIIEYCSERGNSIDPNEFFDHYEANGWVRGKTKIKDWKACVRTWESKNKKNGRTNLFNIENQNYKEGRF